MYGQKSTLQTVNPFLKTLKSWVGAALFVSVATCGGDDATGPNGGSGSQQDPGSVTVSVSSSRSPIPVAGCPSVRTR